MKAALTAERLREVLHYDRETGVFTWKVTLSRRAQIGAVAGAINVRHGYRYVSIDRVLYRACRLAWLHIHGVSPDGDIDHVNGIRCDDRLGNLRVVTRSVNLQNLRGAKSNNVSGLLGVSKHRGHNREKPWFSRIKANGKIRFLGYFATPEEAHNAYVEAKRQQHEGCTI